MYIYIYLCVYYISYKYVYIYVFSKITGGLQIIAALLGPHIEISATPLISSAPLNAAFIRIATIFY